MFFQYFLLSLLLCSCATPELTKQDLQQRLLRGMSAADVMTVLGTPQAQEYVAAKEIAKEAEPGMRKLFYDGFVLNFRDDRLDDIISLQNTTEYSEFSQLVDVKVQSQARCEKLRLLTESLSSSSDAGLITELVTSYLSEAGNKMTDESVNCTVTPVWSYRPVRGVFSSPPLLSEPVQASEGAGLYYRTYYAATARRYYTQNTKNLFEGRMELVFRFKEEIYKTIDLNIWTIQDSETHSIKSVMGFLRSSGPKSLNLSAQRAVQFDGAQIQDIKSKYEDYSPNMLLTKKETKSVVPPYHIAAYLNNEALFLAALENQVDLNGFTMDSNALCVAVRAGFSKGTAAILKAGFDNTLRIRNPLGVYIFPQDCIQLQRDPATLASLKQVILDHEAELAAKEKDSTKAPDKKSSFDWQKIKDFLEPVKPEKK